MHPADAASSPHPNDHHETIARRAYGIWERRGRPHGQDLEIWLCAEATLQEEEYFRQLLRDITLENTLRENDVPEHWQDEGTPADAVPETVEHR
jgi:hypothetical protein